MMDGWLAGGRPSLGLLGLACLLLAGCGSDIPPPPGTGIEGTVLLGPTCPVVTSGDPSCDDRPYAARLVVQTAEHRPEIVARFRSDDRGEYQVDVAPGTYTIASDPDADGQPWCASDGGVTVTSGRYAVERVSCDTGIR